MKYFKELLFDKTYMKSFRTRFIGVIYVKMQTIFFCLVIRDCYNFTNFLGYLLFANFPLSNILVLSFMKYYLFILLILLTKSLSDI